jgi:hypothetical protein
MEGVKMLGGMLVFGIVAAAHMAAGKAETQMDPGVSHLKAFLAAVSARLHLADLLDVCAGRHGFGLRSEAPSYYDS